MAAASKEVILDLTLIDLILSAIVLIESCHYVLGHVRPKYYNPGDPDRLWVKKIVCATHKILLNTLILTVYLIKPPPHCSFVRWCRHLPIIVITHFLLNHTCLHGIF